MNSEYSPIGTIRSPFAQPTDKPIQPAGAIGIQGTIEVLNEFRAGLKLLFYVARRPVLGVERDDMILDRHNAVPTEHRRRGRACDRCARRGRDQPVRHRRFDLSADVQRCTAAHARRAAVGLGVRHLERQSRGARR